MCYTAGEVKKMRTPEQVREILRALAQAYPAECSLQYQKDYELLFAVRLAAQCTDERVNQITPALFARFPTLEAFAAAEPEDVEPYVRSCGFFRAKARDIVLCARKLVAEYGGRVPDTMEALTSLPGVGRKTANLIFAVRLAAQCTDERVNQITPALFARFPTLEAFAAAEPEDVEPYVRSCGFFRAKARDIVLCARKLVAEYGGRVPDTMEALTSLPGVGRKTANLILGDVYHKPAVVVDTHCIRLSNRMGLVDGLKDPVKIETALRKILPSEESSDFCHRLVLHGRAVCTARKPLCSTCCVRHVCQTAEEMEL